MGASRRIEVIANVASGSVGPTAPAEVEKILADLGQEAKVWSPTPDDLMTCLRSAVDRAPDVLVILAGDGTARAAAELCGPDGPCIAPLAGGTMNMLPHAVYGERSWQEALTLALAQGQPRMLGGGEVESRRFLVAAIVGSPALLAPAREAARAGKPKLALLKARLAMRRAFSGRLRYSLDDGQREKGEALTFICPLASRVLDSGAQALEAASLDVRSAGDLIRLGFHALTGDWRNDPKVQTEPCRTARIWSAQAIPALLDGEMVRLKSLTEIRYQPRLVRVLQLPSDLRPEDSRE